MRARPVRSPGARSVVRCEQVRPVRATAGLADDVRAHLLGAPRSLPPKYFYDARGSHLFDRICELPEYYPTRTECALLERHAAEIAGAARPGRVLELGAGSGRKASYVLDACAGAGLHPLYAPFDVCAEALVDSAEALARRHPWLDVRPLVGDYSAGLRHLPPGDSPTLYMFLGSSIGNFLPDEAAMFLGDVCAGMRRGDRLLIGIDRIKDPAVLHAAYNDSAGITAEFNRNVLHVLNRELRADFDALAFDHYACYEPAQGRIAMHLVSARDQRVRFGALGTTTDFAEGETILTEVSCKYTRRGIDRLLAAGGFTAQRHFEAPGNAFSLLLAEPA